MSAAVYVLRLAAGLLLGFAAIYLVFYIVSWIFLILVSLTINPKKEYKKTSPFYTHMLNYGYRLICSQARVRIHATGIELLPKDQKFMFVSNHRSNFDNMIHCIVMHRYPMAFLSKQENFKIPLARRYITRCRYISMDRGNPKQGLLSILNASGMIASGECSMGVFPEGTRSKSGELLEFKPGCFKIALKAKCPVVIGVTRGTEKIHYNFPWKHTDVYFDIIKVLDYEEIKNKSTLEISDEVRSVMENALA